MGASNKPYLSIYVFIYVYTFTHRIVSISASIRVSISFSMGVSPGLCRRLWLSSDGCDRSGHGDVEREVKSPPAGPFRAWGLRCRGWRLQF